LSATPSAHPVACNLCGRAEHECIATQRGLRIVRCRACGLVYVNPRPTAEQLAVLYADYHARDGGNEESWDGLMSRVFGEAADLLCANRTMSGSARVLDVGCGFGGFVDLMRKRGWDAEGMDPSQAVVDAAIRNGRHVRLGTLEAFPTDVGPYDAVTMFYVLEHLPDPMGALRKAFDLLVPGGTLVIRVPHTTPIFRLLAPVGLGRELYDPPFHLYDFAPVVLQEMLRRAGFVDIRTFPGQPTVPSRPGPRLAALFFGAVATRLHVLTRGAFLLPGVSKNTLARKPSR
jgi:SAM-dependent methyltransferase